MTSGAFLANTHFGGRFSLLSQLPIKVGAIVPDEEKDEFANSIVSWSATQLPESNSSRY